MRVSENWLREWVNPEVDTFQLADTLTMAGLEVDSVEPAAPDFSGVIVAKVLNVVKHSDAKKLSVCEVDDGAGSVNKVICGDLKDNIPSVWSCGCICKSGSCSSW